MSEEKKFSIKETTVVAVLDYLATKPFREVANIIGAIQSDVQSSTQPKQTNVKGVKAK